MEHPRIVDLVRRACVEARNPGPSLLDGAGEIPVAHYTDPARLARERARLFRALPLPIAHAAELGPGSAVVREIDGVSLVLARADGRVRAFKNSCRHRGVRLLREDCRAKAFVCPYHGWTYATDGRLLHAPHAEAFPCALKGKDLVPVVAEERHGLVWVALDDGAPSVASFLGDIDEELASLGLDSHVVGARAVREHRGNWKLLIEAFLDGYHVRTLHRESLYRFFLDARNHATRARPHIRTASARRSAASVDVAGETFAAQKLRDLATFTFTVFPATTIIAHPDWTSIVVVQPLGTDRLLWWHTQLLPEEPKTEAARAHFERSFRHIDGTVFGVEDLGVVAEAQAGIDTGANDVLTFGRLESPAVWFHEELAARLGDR